MAQATLSGCLVRVLDRKGDPCGVGFLADPEHVITCAHVVADAQGWPRTSETPPEDAATVEVDFPLLAPGEALTARICEWHPMREPPTAGVPEDIAVLELERAAPAGAEPPPLFLPTTADEYLWRKASLYGVPAGLDDGDHIQCLLAGRLANGRVRVNRAADQRAIRPGFSGGPVWDSAERAVAGIVVWAGKPSEDQLADMIPAEVLREVWPGLDERSRAASPYRGLDAFREGDAPFYHGPEAAIADLVRMVGEAPLVSLIGASGSGKSSLLAAGLVPRLKASDWRVVSFRPQKDPFGELSRVAH